MFQIRYGYEYGIIEFRIVFVNSLNFQQIVVCHRQTQGTNSVLLSDPNQPIRVRVDNGASGGSFSANVRGRYYAYSRTNCRNESNHFRSPFKYDSRAGNFVPTISFRRKAIFPDGSNRNNSVNVQIHSFDILGKRRFKMAITIWLYTYRGFLWKY